MAVLNILLYRYGEISLVSYGYCTRACGTCANTLELTRDISRYQCNKIYIVYVYTAPARIYTPLIVSGSLRSLITLQLGQSHYLYLPAVSNVVINGKGTGTKNVIKGTVVTDRSLIGVKYAKYAEICIKVVWVAKNGCG